MIYHIKTLPFSIHKKHPHKIENGILLSKVPYTQEYHPHATAIASYVIETGDKNNLQWLLDNMDSNGAIHHNFVFPFYPMKKGWVGGLAQGLTASALSQNGYKKEAKRSINAMKKYCDNGFCIQEYPNIEILNGWIYAIFGIYDSGEISYFQKNIERIIERLPFFDMRNWSKYDSYHQYPSTPFYHNVHVQQLKALYKIEENKTIKKYVDKWSNPSFIHKKYYGIKKNIMVIKNSGFAIFHKYNQRKRWLKQ